MCMTLRLKYFFVCRNTILIVHSHQCMWSLKVDLGVLYDFFIYCFGGKELPPLGNSGLNRTALCIGKSKSIQPEFAPLCENKVRKTHEYKYCAAVKNFPTDLGKGIHERGRTKRSSRFWSWRRLKRIKGSVEQRGRQESKGIRGAKGLDGQMSQDSKTARRGKGLGEQSV